VIRFLALCLAVLLPAALPARAADRASPIIIRAGKADSPNHALAVQFAEAVANGSNGALTLVIEKSQGSVQNVMDAPRRGANNIFTTAPNVIAQARRGDKPFKHNARYRDIRALFPIPPQTMHWVVRADSSIEHFDDLVGKPFIPGGKGSFAERQTASLLHVLGLEKTALLIDMDAARAPAALADKQAAGMALAGPYPIAALAELARKVPLRLLSLSQGDLAKVLAADDSLAAEVIPQGTYPGIDDAVTTVALPAGAYTTTRMSDATAYAITKAFWTGRQALIERNPAWSAVAAAPSALQMLGVPLHRGALRYYREIGVEPAAPAPRRD
jgi:TRAP transporter TAXI family solute receptor